MNYEIGAIFSGSSTCGMLHKITSKIAFIALFTGLHFAATAQPGGYPPISAVKKGPLNPLSPDPIFNYVWADPKATDGLESYKLKAVRLFGSNPKSFDLKQFKSNDLVTVNEIGRAHV